MASPLQRTGSIFLCALPAGQELAPQSSWKLAACCSSCVQRTLFGAASRQWQQIQTQLQLLRGEREGLEALRGNESQKHQEYQQKAAAERQKIVAAFERLRQFLEEQEQLMLAELGEVESSIEKSQGETVTQLSEEISHLANLIRELEGKCQQAASDLLQDMRSTLSRYVAPPDSP
ncbi:hypothetical protein Y1Q_0006826 [Alligator mississippiensis]|uniref:Uncharacterized protein n=1 Tax=Alligator mississippiensis TaxID=8496 RepID=A0A151M5S4_ALLMI|nr:hypothetical protein Y1Q_0006826 [Alligator mississippiensis]